MPTIALGDPGAAPQAGRAWKGRVLASDEGVRELVVASGADLVLNGMVGSAGLGPTIVALTEGIDVALANKESLVVGGELVTALAEATDARIIPVDSEHSALFQLIGAEPPGHVERLVLTASGGPFRGRTDLSGVTPEEALAHPTWEMGGRITIDSATLMNKGFELIEAHHLFGLGYERIDVAVHPQSIVHGLVHLNDGASLAHLGLPDMRVPISYALHYPERADVDLPDPRSWRGGRADLRGTRPRDVPVPAPGPRGRRGGGRRHAFSTPPTRWRSRPSLEAGSRSPMIAEVVGRTLEALPAATPGHFEDLYAADSEARDHAQALIDGAGVSR